MQGRAVERAKEMDRSGKMAFRRFAEMGFSKIESQHKSQHDKKRQTKNKSHTTPMKIADTLSETREEKRAQLGTAHR